MKRTDKEQLVTELKREDQGRHALYYTDFTGLNVKRMTELRRRLRKAGVEYVVIKNSLALRAVNESGLRGAERSRDRRASWSRRTRSPPRRSSTDFAKENEQRPSVKGGVYEGAAIDAGAGEEARADADPRRGARACSSG